MKQIFKILIFSSIPILLSLIVVCCKDDDNKSGVFPKPEIAKLTPTQGIIGTQVTLEGLKLNDVTLVKFGGVEITSFTKDATSIKTSVPAGVAAGPIDVAVYYKGSSEDNRGASAHASFTVLYPPTISDVNKVSAVAGTEVKITGEYLKDATSLKLDDLSLDFKATSTTLTFIVPDVDADKVGNLTVVTPGGSFTFNTQTFTAVEQNVVINSFSPAQGKVGSEVKLTGLKFVDVQSIKIGATNVVTYTVVSPTEIKLTVPVGTVSGSTIQVTTANKGSFTTSGTFAISNNPTESRVVYGEGINAADWEIYGGYGLTSKDFDNGEITNTGIKAIKVVYSETWGALQLNSKAPITGYTSVRLHIRAGTGMGNTQGMKININGGAEVQLPNVKEGEFSTYTIPLSDLGAATAVTGEIRLFNGGSAGNVFYIDDIELLK